MGKYVQYLLHNLFWFSKRICQATAPNSHEVNRMFEDVFKVLVSQGNLKMLHKLRRLDYGKEAMALVRDRARLRIATSDKSNYHFLINAIFTAK